jgi:hypothetical protein
MLWRLWPWLLADGAGPLYRQVGSDDLGDITKLTICVHGVSTHPVASIEGTSNAGGRGTRV